MDTEPERPIEKLLRACANKRSDEAGGPFELHSATRRLLQAEVARELAKGAPRGDSPFAFFARVWPRLACGTAIFVALVIAVWVVIPRIGTESRNFDLAKYEPASRTTPDSQPPAPRSASRRELAPTAGQSRVDLDAESLKEDKALHEVAGPRLQRANDPGVPMPRPAVKNSPAVADIHGGVQEKETSGIAPAAPAPASARAPGPTETLARRYGVAPPTPMPAVTPPPSAPPRTTTVAGSAASADSLVAAEGESQKNKEEAPIVARRAAVTSAAPAPGLAGAARNLNKDRATDVAQAPGNYSNAQRSTQVQRFARAAPLSGAMLDGRPSRAQMSEATVMTAPMVLLSFQVEQHGRELRMIDGDGSVYSGYVQPVGDSESGRSGPAARPAKALKAPADQFPSNAPSAPPAKPAVEPAYLFRVTGTNRTLGKQVVFNGKLTAVTNVTSFPVRMRTNAPSGTSTVPVLFNSHIEGKVSIDGGKEVEMQAVPAGP